MSNLELNFDGSAPTPGKRALSSPPAVTSQPGLAPGSAWNVGSNRQITWNEVKRPIGHEPYQHVRIEEDGAEYELNFGLEATEAQIMAEPLKYWRII